MQIQEEKASWEKQTDHRERANPEQELLSFRRGGKKEDKEHDPRAEARLRIF